MRPGIGLDMGPGMGLDRGLDIGLGRGRVAWPAPHAYPAEAADRVARSGNAAGKTMATTLFEMSVPTFLQTTRAVAGCLAKARAHCMASGTDPDALVTARLSPDMAPF